MTQEPKWHDKATEALQNSIELVSPGAMSFAVGNDGKALGVAPSLFEYEEEDESVYSMFHVDVSSLVEVFDNPPDIDWRTHPESALSLGGTIDGEEALIQIFGQPFEDAEPIGFIDKDGNIHGVEDEVDDPMEELGELFAVQVDAFRKKFGREPDSTDPLFFDPNADEPVPLDEEAVMGALVDAGKRAGISPAHLYALQKTGLIVSDANRHLFSDAQIQEWNAGVEEGLALHGAENQDSDGSPDDKLN